MGELRHPFRWALLAALDAVGGFAAHSMIVAAVGTVFLVGGFLVVGAVVGGICAVLPYSAGSSGMPLFTEIVLWGLIGLVFGGCTLMCAVGAAVAIWRWSDR